jgi:hypothetical protein
MLRSPESLTACDECALQAQITRSLRHAEWCRLASLLGNHESTCNVEPTSDFSVSTTGGSDWAASPVGQLSVD